MKNHSVAEYGEKSKPAAAFTPGPWHIGGQMQLLAVSKKRPEGHRLIGFGNGAAHIGYISVTGCVKQDEADANAALIAAAPDLLTALETMLASYGEDEIAATWQLQEARAAIAKAKGEA